MASLRQRKKCSELCKDIHGCRIYGLNEAETLEALQSKHPMHFQPAAPMRWVTMRVLNEEYRDVVRLAKKLWNKAGKHIAAKWNLTPAQVYSANLICC